MIMARRVAPFVYIVIGILADVIFSEKVSSVVWSVGALALGALYVFGPHRPSSNPERAARRAARRGR